MVTAGYAHLFKYGVKGMKWGRRKARDSAGGVARMVSSPLTVRVDQDARGVTSNLKPVPPPPRPEIVSQPGVKDIDGLLKQADEAEPEYSAKLKVLAEKIAGSRVVPPEEVDDFFADYEVSGKPGIVVLRGPTKRKGKILEKLKDYKEEKGGILPAAQIGDIHRATIAVDRMDQIPDMLKAIGAAGFELAREPKVRIAEATSAGYRDVLTNVKLSNGHTVELQVNTKKMLLAKNKAHKFYDKQLVIQKKAQDDGRAHRNKEGKMVYDLNDKEKEAFDRLEGKQLKIYQSAWRASGG